ncbi:MAG TPA: septum site-determining protein MinC, partial [Kofleriaceae bacterium]|nr:septum site-determining protein MinC [Kofleriaceae bacterium]
PAEVETATGGPRLVIGPVRSGVVLEHIGHLIVFGDVNPGAEVRAAGNIVVLGRLRGTAHAGIGQDVGFILALRLEPQQLRIGRQVARAADSDTPPTDAEIAYVTGGGIVVERYLGKLPRNLATSL